MIHHRHIWRLFALTAMSRLLSTGDAAIGQTQAFRPPAVPLVTHDPYLSVWSMSEKLTDSNTRHWTKREHPLLSLIRVDGKAYRLMGTEPKDVPAMPQVRLTVTPTQTEYRFCTVQVYVSLRFTTPALPDDLDVLARPVTYLTWTVRSADGRPHAVQLFQSTSALLAVNDPKQPVDWDFSAVRPLAIQRAGTVEQPLLRPSGDDTRIDWGYVYTAAPSSTAQSSAGAVADRSRAFVTTGTVPPSARSASAPARPGDFGLTFAIDAGKVGKNAVSRHMTIAYDELYAVQFLGRKLRPYWRRKGMSPAELLLAAERDYPVLMRRCEAFDGEMMADLTRAGGQKYAQLCALAYRQALAGCGWAADSNGQLLIFTKENTSNGCIATTDVFYPAAPQFLLMGPAYAKALVAPVLVYSTSPKWIFPFAPHDIGTYPRADAQVYGGGESPGNEADKMPVEESGNMILLCDAIAHMEGNAKFASRWWPQLTQWEAYLEKYGLDPENQLCTDDFMGHLAHNSNLSVKAILAIAAYGDMCRLRGDTAAYRKYIKLARDDAKHWMQAARDGDHYRIAFDQPNTWSQKYNLVWDRLLGLNVFPASVARDEVAWYKHVMQKYGVPLDSRTKLTKSDWSVWSATLAARPADFEAIVSPIYDYLNATTCGSPFPDSYVTTDLHSDGMHARPVIGGIFIKMLADPAMWRKWAGRDTAKVGGWAPAPTPPVLTEVVPTGRTAPATWRYTFGTPGSGWQQPGFDDSAWKSGPGGFGTLGTPGAVIGTRWNTADVWLRREITIPAGADTSSLQFLVYHDEDVDIYLDGVPAAREGGFVTEYVPVEINPSARNLLKPGAKLLLAVHCHQTTGGQGVDAGLVSVKQR